MVEIAEVALKRSKGILRDKNIFSFTKFTGSLLDA